MNKVLSSAGLVLRSRQNNNAFSSTSWCTRSLSGTPWRDWLIIDGSLSTSFIAIQIGNRVWVSWTVMIKTMRQCRCSLKRSSRSKAMFNPTGDASWGVVSWRSRLVPSPICRWQHFRAMRQRGSGWKFWSHCEYCLPESTSYLKQNILDRLQAANNLHQPQT
nr:hypothetical protein Iba_chr01cCG11150 [Ipomoea batatas]